MLLSTFKSVPNRHFRPIGVLRTFRVGGIPTRIRAPEPNTSGGKGVPVNKSPLKHTTPVRRDGASEHPHSRHPALAWLYSISDPRS